MTSIWNDISNFEGRHKFDPGGCRTVIARSKSVDEIKEYLNFILIQLLKGDVSFIKPALKIAVPLAYRLAIDDSSVGYPIASLLRDASLSLAFPGLMDSVKSEIDWLCKSAFGLSYIELDELRMRINGNFEKFSANFKGEWSVFSRLKSHSSIMSKLIQIQSGKKSPKIKDPELMDRIKNCCTQFESQVEQRLKGELITFKPYDFSDIKWLLPDLLGFTLQLKNSEKATKNLGSSKSIYQGIYNKLSLLNATVYFGPSYSESWHMNRMVCYLQGEMNYNTRIAFELFVRTDVDYFIGYGNYWRYKGMQLFASSDRETLKYRNNFVRKIKDFNSFTQVQEMLFSELTTGQLELL